MCNYTVIKDDKFITVQSKEDEWGNCANGVNIIRIFTHAPNTLFVDITRSIPNNLPMLTACIAFAETPPDERGMETRYIVPLPRLKTTDGEQQYLTQKGKNWFACRRTPSLRQTWKKEHLQYIPDEYRQYAVEVADEQKKHKEE
ncbi:MAG: hypothetical protein E7E84_06715 [Peptoniphilus lacydonensis]|uniref:hypothetical protein n=1 Tax=Peptoniphilus lacydonensis TaxID=1673725 RepID=UPI002903CF30|nr:hypothetical protein [Peptoniphilus lacydonensis]MDU2116025.1 hypothetical protein [Peptoniphilus lacydonensis]